MISWIGSIWQKNLGNELRWEWDYGMLLVGTTILVVNLPLLVHILKTPGKMSLVDRLCFSDLVINIMNVPLIVSTAYTLPKPEWMCQVQMILMLSCIYLNRMLPMGIVSYRYMCVCQYHRVQDKSQRRKLDILIQTSMLVASISMTWVIFINR